jgi:hypothetical protein
VAPGLAVTSRRAFLSTALALAAAGCARTPPVPPGAMLSTNHALGHRLRGGPLPGAIETRRARVAIVGAGIGGLAAAWRLRRAGFTDFEILELEDRPGGNARWGESAATAYPWGAHYIPLPTPESRSTRLLLAELGVLHGDPDAASPRYDERALCQAPQERMYRNGTWEEGLAPLAGRTAAELGEWQRFHERMREFRELRGRDGRRAFAIPLDFSSRDPELLALDRVTMDAWMRAEGFASEAVRWLVRYACRDDYGTAPGAVSAWAGIHYFACRREHEEVLTWPEGNGFVVRELMRRCAFPVTPAALVHGLRETERRVALDVFLGRENRGVRIEAEHVVWAAQLGLGLPSPLGEGPRLEYAPWLVANLFLSEPPYVSQHGAPLSWDNVIYDSPALGYVVANHQGVATTPGATVLTWYLPLSGEPAATARRRLLEAPREHWAEMALADLQRAHPEIRDITVRVDVHANGHAMVRPRPGLIWGAARQRLVARRGRIHLAHADASGLSLFEEACDRGVAAAEAVLAALGHKINGVRHQLG